MQVFSWNCLVMSEHRKFDVIPKRIDSLFETDLPANFHSASPLSIFLSLCLSLLHQVTGKRHDSIFYEKGRIRTFAHGFRKHRDSSEFFIFRLIGSACRDKLFLLFYSLLFTFSSNLDWKCSRAK